MTDFFLYILEALTVAFILGAFAWARAITKQLGTQDKALAVLISEVTPPNGTPLRELVQTNALETAKLSGQFIGATAAHASSPAGTTAAVIPAVIPAAVIPPPPRSEQ